MNTITTTIFLLIVLSICNAKPTVDKKCPTDTIHFATKVEKSPIVVYGKTMGKTLYEENNSIFYVTFQVDCILKGSITDRRINITEAGQVENRTFCQQFPVDNGYTIAFLEPNPLNLHDAKEFIPSDFVEVPFQNNSTDETLANTCYLEHLLPLNSSEINTDVCPAVSTSPHCIPTTMNIPHELPTIGSGLLPNVIPGESKPEIDRIRSKSGSAPVNADGNSANHSINISILLMLMAISFLQLN